MKGFFTNIGFFCTGLIGMFGSLVRHKPGLFWQVGLAWALNGKAKATLETMADAMTSFLNILYLHFDWHDRQS